MKNYTDKLYFKMNNFEEIPERDYTTSQLEMRTFVNSMSPIIKAAKCGWDSVRYAVMTHPNTKEKREYMVLLCDSRDVRFIPIDGNSKGCNFSVLGENIW